MAKIYASLAFVATFLHPNEAWAPGDSRPNLIYILADDLGYNDISWNNNDIISPTMQDLATKGVILDQFYVQPSCSPSRAALLTGQYPIHTGFNGGALGWKQKVGLESKFTTLAERLTNDYGYKSHMLGKWHLGYCNSSYLPQERGFATFKGIWHSGTDHYYYMQGGGYDLHDGEGIDLQSNGTYSSVLYGNEAASIISNHDATDPLFMYVALQNIHTPLEAPNEYKRLYRGINLTRQRKLASAMVTAIDDTVKQIKTALEGNGDMWANTIIIFSSDNGGQPVAGGASNLPLRGGKNTWFEGGLRVPSFVYSPLFDGAVDAGINSCMFHITDWYSTIMTWAGNKADLGIDGMDQWETLKNGGSICTRSSVLHNIITDRRGNVDTATYREGDMKIIIGDAGALTGWIDVDQTETIGPVSSTYLFNITADPNETKNLAEDASYATYISDMTATIESYVSGIYEFSTSGRCDESEVVDSNGYWITGCCNI